MKIDFLSSLDFTDKILNEAFDFETKHFIWPWKKEDWENLGKEFYLCVAVQSEILLGMALFEKSIWSEVSHLHKIVVVPQERGKLIGEKLILKSIEEFLKLEATSLYLEVQSKNIIAISFYKKLGFEFLNVKKAFYRDGSDAFAMQKKLS